MKGVLEYPSNSFIMCTKDFRHMLDEARTNSHGNNEFGYSVYGVIVGLSSQLVLKMVNPKDNCVRTPTSFIIDKDFAYSVTKEIEERGLIYLGTIHTHLGYGGHSQGDDREARRYFENNPHKNKLASLVIDISRNDYDIYIISYEKQNGKIVKKQMNLVLISSKKYHKLTTQYLSTINIVRSILSKLERVLKISCSIINRLKTNEYIIQIPLDCIKKEMIRKEVGNYIIKTNREDAQLFFYVSIPSLINLEYPEQERIFVGIASRDYSTDISFCQFKFNHLLNATIMIDVIQRIYENCDKCLRLPVSQFLLREVYIN